ncbi:unnamed protein product [Musa acuminata subsp. burmannicoides]
MVVQYITMRSIILQRHARVQLLLLLHLILYRTTAYTIIIMFLNSSKLNTPSPLRSNLQIMVLHSSMPLDVPSRLSILFRLPGVMQPSFPSSSYILNAALKSLFLSSSPSTSTNFTKSSKSNSPSPSRSANLTKASASSSDSSSPMFLMQAVSSAAEIFPSPSLSKEWKTESRSVTFEQGDAMVS